MTPPRPLFRPLLDSGSYSSAGGAAGRKMNVKRAKKGKKRPFLWALITTLNLFVVVAVWVSVSTLISQPERPVCYQILGIFGKQPELKALERKDLGSSLLSMDAQELSLKYGELNHLQLDELNRQLLRGYITNYRRSEQVPVLQGEFELVGARLLGPGDFVESGMVILARSTQTQGNAQSRQRLVYLEYILPTSAESLPDLGDLGLSRQVGGVQPKLKLRATRELATLTHVSYLENSDLLLSAIPVSYQSPRFADGRKLEMQAPRSVNLEGSLPVLDAAEIGLEMDTSILARELAADLR